ncbi:MAG: TetR/AcrR family transcriptional regulator [Oscillospiraceae bacterium]|nr:TetR/AcrR family transcriptional regulator [Oscillospiraceae bacterium]
MPRHDPTEKTKSDILHTARRLFMEKGFEDVNIADIVSELGMTRGAFYHYFESREMLIHAVIDQMFMETNPLAIAAEQEGLNALEKLRFALLSAQNSGLDPGAESLRMAMTEIMTNPIIFKSEALTQVNTIAPFLEKLLIEGNEDGSMSVKYPKQAAQVYSLLPNIWLTPSIFPVSLEEYVDKISFLGDMMEWMGGVPVMTDEIKTLIIQQYEQMLQA